jgi:hypothetical protein
MVSRHADSLACLPAREFTLAPYAVRQSPFLTAGAIARRALPG